MDLQSAFEVHGKVLDAYNSKKGFAFVTFSKASEATAAIEAFDKQVACGCSVKVSLSGPKGGEVTSRDVVDTFYKPDGSFAFVTFASAAEANNAIVAMNGKIVCGRAIQCSVAKPMENGRGGGRRIAGGQGGRGAKSGFV